MKTHQLKEMELIYEDIRERLLPALDGVAVRLYDDNDLRKLKLLQVRLTNAVTAYSPKEEA